MKRSIAFASAVFAAYLVAPATTPAMSAPLFKFTGPAVHAQNNVLEVRWRGHHAGRYGGRHFGGRYGYHRRGPGWGPTVGGLAAGAIIGSAIANSNARTNNNAYCMNRFKSYNSASGTYMGYDGQRSFLPVTRSCGRVPIPAAFSSAKACNPQIERRVWWRA